MESLIILVPLSLAAVFCAVWFFFRMSNSGQFDDDQGPAWSVILDDDLPAVERSEETTKK
jgi:cbb3-type cytochrome oxidase maturation protein